MKKYRAASSVFGLAVGDVIESDDPYYATLAAAGHLVELGGDEGGSNGKSSEGTTGGAELGNEESVDVEGGAGAEQGTPTVQSRHRNPPKVD